MLRVFILICLCIPVVVMATHNRAGEITYEQIGDLTIRATITTYTKASSTAADRDSLIMNWGDGSMSTLVRVNGNGSGVVLPGDLKYNVYVGEHTYPGRSTYTMSMLDPNRIGNILNINNGNSITVTFYIQTTVTFFNPQFQGYNNSAILLQPPIDQGCIGQRFIHNPNAFDPDGDSLSYELVTPLENLGEPVPNYILPSGIEPGFNNRISFDEKTGEFVWDAPQRMGEYNIAIRINEHRNGQRINSIMRDMQITIVDCINRPPIVTTDDHLCVVAGETIDIPVTVTDPDIGDKVRLSASGGPFLVDESPATLDHQDHYSGSPLQARFVWNTTCSHIARPDYSVVFKGEDDEFIQSGDTTGLVDLYSLLIHVSGPSPIDVRTTSIDGAVALDWAYPYRCMTTLNNYFRGFTVWRSRVPIELELDTCGMDLEQYGYEPIAYQVQDTINQRFSYVDDEVHTGITYCYRVTAEFALLSPGGNPYNRLQSLPSNETCIQVSRDLPLITHVTVDETDEVDGAIKIRWVAPLAEHLDTIDNPPPYRYQLLHAEMIDGVDFEIIPAASFDFNSFSEMMKVDSFEHREINTHSIGHNYTLELLSGQPLQSIGSSQSASSIDLQAVGTDRRVELNWACHVPWYITDYTVYRRESGATEFDSIASIKESYWTDQDVVNEELYCYYILSKGRYGLSDINEPLENLSQIKCVVPVDSVPPCQPILKVSNNCTELNPGEPILRLENDLLWQFDHASCTDSSDIREWLIYQILKGDTILIDRVEDPDSREYLHNIDPINAGCYYIIAVDENDNYSQPSQVVCTDICPEYELPNVFTPNQDGAHDLFNPMPYRFIDHVEMKIYTRWGELVFETSDPNINWDGRDLRGQELNADVYYYTCIVYAFSSDEIPNKFKELTGHITLIR